ncbi:enoyl-CoA-hydratase DpgD [Micromonospora sp. HM5-17]|jgi:crotonobetainyl-CoA hydratase/dehydration protein DpgD|uniref:enoyl-CoA-hydratase DpgD n=1 Tax=Micromonospora sp. HM5-17 TaxID=2487710 RepID=UPI000F4A0C2E|nr:enoyl-CoA-hydratase DpgD [Micromonospora sp. HM5-17]ROT31564.1 enoyl-CoA hydratase [Micromonospora sp. HM5-17]
MSPRVGAGPAAPAGVTPDGRAGSTPAARAGTDPDRPRVRYEKRDGVAWVTLDRPEVLNALDGRTHEELAAVWTDVEADPEVRVAVLTGAGDRAFSVGQDLRERVRLTEQGAGPFTIGSRDQPGWPRLTERFDLSKPVIARVNGYALGGGFELVLACDLAIAARNAVFALPEARLGLIPGAGGVFRLARQLPLKTAMGYLLTGRRLSAEQALRFGLVNEVVEPEDLDGCVARWVDDVIRSAPLSVAAIKECVHRSLDMSLEQAFATRYVWEERRMRSQDAVEGPRAFLEKRPPVWSGR